MVYWHAHHGIPAGKPITNLEFFVIRTAAIVGGLLVGWKAGVYVNEWFGPPTKPFAEIRKTLKRESPQLTDEEYAEAKAGLLEYLLDFTEEGDALTIMDGNNAYSINEIQQEVEQDTEVGRTYVRMYFDDSREETLFLP